MQDIENQDIQPDRTSGLWKYTRMRADQRQELQIFQVPAINQTMFSDGVFTSDPEVLHALYTNSKTVSALLHVKIRYGRSIPSGRISRS